MRHTFTFILSTIVGCMLVACGGEKSAASAFVERLSEQLESHNADSIAAVYPGAQTIEAFHAKALVDKGAKLESCEGGVWKVTVGDSIVVTFGSDEQGVFHVKESHGLADFGYARLNFARATGWVEQGMTDLQIFERLKDTQFVDWVGQGFLEELKKKVKLEKTGTFGDEREGGKWICSDGIIMKITNFNSFVIPGDTYELHCQDISYTSYADTTVEVVNGEDLPDHGKRVMNVDIFTTMDSKSSQELHWNDAALLRLIYANYKPTGNEYEQYKQR